MCFCWITSISSIANFHLQIDHLPWLFNHPGYAEFWISKSSDCVWQMHRTAQGKTERKICARLRSWPLIFCAQFTYFIWCKYERKYLRSFALSDFYTGHERNSNERKHLHSVALVCDHLLISICAHICLALLCAFALYVLYLADYSSHKLKTSTLTPIKIRVGQHAQWHRNKFQYPDFPHTNFRTISPQAFAKISFSWNKEIIINRRLTTGRTITILRSWINRYC